MQNPQCLLCLVSSLIDERCVIYLLWSLFVVETEVQFGDLAVAAANNFQQSIDASKINLTWTQQRDDGYVIQLIKFVEDPKHQALKTPKCRETRPSQVVIPSINRAAQMSSFVPKRQFPISSISCAQCKPQRARAFVSTDLMLHWGPRKSWWLWGRTL